MQALHEYLVIASCLHELQTRSRLEVVMSTCSENGSVWIDLLIDPSEVEPSYDCHRFCSTTCYSCWVCYVGLAVASIMPTVFRGPKQALSHFSPLH